MDKSKMIWGIICLVIAGGLVVANLTLPPENLMFQVGEQNMPWIPPVVLGVIGIILVATAGEDEEKATQKAAEAVTQPQYSQFKADLNKRLETSAWGVFLVMLGGFMFVPEEIIKGGWWSIGVGLIFLGLNAARYFNGLRMSGFTLVLGLLSVLGGISELAGWTSLEGGFLLIILGAYLILKPYFDKRQMFGKAEEA